MFMNSWFESVFSFILLEIPTLNILLLLLYCQVFQKCIIVISFICSIGSFTIIVINITLILTAGHMIGNGSPSALQYMPAIHTLQSIELIAAEAFL